MHRGNASPGRTGRPRDAVTRSSATARTRVATRTVLAAVALVVLAGCSLFGGDDAAPPPTVPVTSSTTAPTPTDSVPATPSTTPSPDVSTSPATTPVPTATRWPRAVGEPQQGDSVWGVYLAVAHSSTDPSLQAAQKSVAPHGYSAAVADVACDDGAMTALKLDRHDYWVGAALYFTTKKDATDFANSYLTQGGTVIGTAKVAVGCLD